MRSSVLSDVVIFSQRDEVVKTASDYLKIKGVNNLVAPKSAAECNEALDRFPKALLILDWELGAEAAVKVLAFNRKRYAITGRPLLLLASSVSEVLVATAAEYAVAQIFTEAPTLKNLGARLSSLILAETLGDDVRKTLLEVGDKRAGGDLKGALQALQKALGKHPTNLRLKCEAAESLLAMGEAEKARAVLEGMDKTKPPYLRGMHLYGRAAMKLGLFPEALKIMEQANLFNPHDAERLVDIGWAMLNLDRAQDANAHFNAALSIDPDLRAARVGKGQVMLMEGQVNEALSMLKEVAGDLELASVFNTCAVLNMRHGRHESGMGLYQAALKSLAKDQRLAARLYFNMGIGYRRWGKKDKALACFAETQRLDPSFKKVQAQLDAMSNATKDKAKEAPPAFAPVVETGATLLGFGSDLAGLLDEDLEENLFGTKQGA